MGESKMSINNMVRVDWPPFCRKKNNVLKFKLESHLDYHNKYTYESRFES